MGVAKNVGSRVDRISGRGSRYRAIGLLVLAFVWMSADRATDVSWFSLIGWGHHTGVVVQWLVGAGWLVGMAFAIKDFVYGAHDWGPALSVLGVAAATVVAPCLLFPSSNSGAGVWLPKANAELTSYMDQTYSKQFLKAGITSVLVFRRPGEILAPSAVRSTTVQFKTGKSSVHQSLSLPGIGYVAIERTGSGYTVFTSPINKRAVSLADAKAAVDRIFAATGTAIARQKEAGKNMASWELWLFSALLSV